MAPISSEQPPAHQGQQILNTKTQEFKSKRLAADSRFNQSRKDQRLVERYQVT